MMLSHLLVWTVIDFLTMRMVIKKMKKKNNRGMTLIEVLIAVILFGLVATPILGVFGYGLKMERRALMHSLATYTAQMKMEEAYGMEAAQLVYGPCDIDDDLKEYGFQYIYSVKPFGVNQDNPSIYDNLNLWEVTIIIKNDSYKVETTLTDVFYAKPIPVGYTT